MPAKMTNEEWEKKYKYELRMIRKYKNIGLTYEKCQNMTISETNMRNTLIKRLGGLRNYLASYNLPSYKNKYNYKIESLIKFWMKNPRYTISQLASDFGICQGTLRTHIKNYGGTEKLFKSHHAESQYAEYVKYCKTKMGKKPRKQSEHMDKILHEMFNKKISLNISFENSLNDLGIGETKVFKYIEYIYKCTATELMVRWGYDNRLRSRKFIEEQTALYKNNRFVNSVLATRAIYLKCMELYPDRYVSFAIKTIAHMVEDSYKKYPYLGKRYSLRKLLDVLDRYPDLSQKSPHSKKDNKCYNTLYTLRKEYFNYDNEALIHDLYHGDLAEAIDITRRWRKFQKRKEDDFWAIPTEEEVINYSIERQALDTLTKEKKACSTQKLSQKSTGSQSRKSNGFKRSSKLAVRKKFRKLRRKVNY